MSARNTLNEFMSTKPGTNLLQNISRIASALERLADTSEAMYAFFKEAKEEETGETSHEPQTIRTALGGDVP